MTNYAHPEKLVSTDWLAEHLDDPTIRIVESNEDMLLYDTGHIPGAVKIDWHCNGWANINRSGHGNEFHTHPGCFWSAVYYVDDGGIGADPALGGELELADPRGVATAMHAPLLGFALPGGQSVGVSETIRPHSGLLVVFPSWLSHAVRPYRGSGIRISIAINFSVQPALVPRLA